MSQLAPLTRTQSTRIERINGYHAGCRSAFNSKVSYAFLAGLELLQLKEETPHGQFTQLREDHMPDLPARTATFYMGFVRAIQTKSAIIADLSTSPKLLTNGDIDEDARQELLKVVHDFADGKAITELCRAIDGIRGAKKPGGKKPTADARRLTSDEKDAEAEEIALDIITQLELHESKWIRLSDDTLDRFRDQLIATGKTLGAKRKVAPRKQKRST